MDIISEGDWNNLLWGRNEETDIERTAGYEGKYKMTKSLNLGELCCRP